MELSSLRNPFRDTVVQDAWQTPADVPEIHHEIFCGCIRGVDSAASNVPDSLIIYGPPGSGKTHVLTRVQKHLAETAKTAPDRVLRCVFVFVRLQTSPQLLWQHVRKRLATDLMRRDEGLTQLQRLLAHQISEKTGATPRSCVMQVRVLGKEDDSALAHTSAQISEALNLPRDLWVVLEQLACERNVRDASAWLAGESLPDAALEQLGVGPDVEEDREQVAREVVTGLCRLAGGTLPIVFCFDQLEALQQGIEDREAFFRFGRMAADLSDADNNVFLITCLQSGLNEGFRNSVRSADWDRIARREMVLDQLTRLQVQQLVETRLAQVPELARANKGQLFPLSETQVRDIASDLPCVPRRVLTRAAREFEVLQRGRAIESPPTPDFLRGRFATRQKRILEISTAADATRQFHQGLEPLVNLAGFERYSTDVSGDVMLYPGEGRTPVALSVRNESDGRALTPRLKRLVASTPRSDGARTIIIRDPRFSLSKAAPKSREYLATLQSRGVEVVEPRVEALAALATLADLLADAKSGDLANDGEPVASSAVIDWIRGLKADLLVEPIEELAEALVPGDDAPPSALIDTVERDLEEELSRSRVIQVEQASAMLNVTAERLLEIARRRSDRMLLLMGPPEVLVDLAGVSVEAEAS